ncbi:MAG: hypothetical protein JW940_02730 [Polyangiaceae bacterium]|nr:hypothetical protein [Polyangiaceae bacterium]
MSNTREPHVSKGFSETNLYLVPASDAEALQPRLVGQQVIAHLRRLGIVAGMYDSRLGWLAAGQRAAELFRDKNAAGFECLIVYDGPSAEFVPNAHTGTFGAVCKRCGCCLDEALRALLRDEQQRGDARERRVSCEACGTSHRLGELRCRHDCALTCFYLNFCNVGSVELAPKVMSELDALVGAELRVVIEHL